MRGEAQGATEARRLLDARVTEQDQRLATLQRQVPPADRLTAGLRIVMADRIAAALRDRAPLGPALAVLRRLDVDPKTIAALEPYATEGAPSAADLAQSFKPLGERILAESGPTAAGTASWTDRLRRLADDLVTVRSVADTGGNNPASLVARINGALARGALRDAAAAWDALPESARRTSEDWGRRLKQRVAAEDASQTFSERAAATLDASTR